MAESALSGATERRWRPNLLSGRYRPIETPQRFEHWSRVPDRIWRWNAFFSPEEIASKGDGSILIVPHALDALCEARAIVNRPFIITSAYRDPVHNARVGGAPMSRHKKGDAFDIRLAGHDKEQLIAACRQAGFTGFGVNYRSFVHVDCGPRRSW